MEMAVYLDNAATTPMAPEVVTLMCEHFKDTFGNPSSSHSFGRTAKGILETSRRNIAKYLNCDPKELIFTSGGTEADNMAINIAIQSLGVQRIITTEIEHHAVELTAKIQCQKNEIELVMLDVDRQGNIDFDQLELVLRDEKPTFVSLMHANNELGTLLDIDRVGTICRAYGAYFHSDTVQTMGHYSFDLKSLPVDFITCAAHKFHGPKGVGFLYVNSRVKTVPMILGGAQERSFRGGTENLIGILGLSKAFDLAYADLKGHQTHVQGLKSYFIEKIQELVPDVRFNGRIEPENALYTVLNVSFPPSDKSGMLLFVLDLKGVACSGGSACSSGSTVGSHVLTGIGADPQRPSIRFSFSRYTTQDDLDFALQVIKESL
jgi:cysteine desulfurase